MFRKKSKYLALRTEANPADEFLKSIRHIVSSNNVQAFQELIDNNDLHQVIVSGNNVGHLLWHFILMTAIANFQVEMVAMLLNKGVDLNRPDLHILRDTLQQLHNARHLFHFGEQALQQIIDNLIRHGADFSEELRQTAIRMHFPPNEIQEWIQLSKIKNRIGAISYREGFMNATDIVLPDGRVIPMYNDQDPVLRYLGGIYPFKEIMTYIDGGRKKKTRKMGKSKRTSKQNTKRR